MSESKRNAAIWRNIAKNERTGSRQQKNATKMANKTDRDAYKRGEYKTK